MSNYTIWGLFGPATWPWWLTTLTLISFLGGMRPRLSAGLAGAAVLSFVMLAILPTGFWLAERLERRFDRPGARPLTDIRHIVVLSGAEHLALSLRAGRLEVSSAGERIIEGAALAHAMPRATLWIVGGVYDPRSKRADVDWTADAWRRLGVPTRQVRVVRNSFDTCENAAGMAARRPRGTLLLVTSAIHMPRAVACFRAQNLDPITYPVDFLNPEVGAVGDLFQPGLLSNIARTDAALHEWIGLAVYRLQHRTRELLPVA